MPTPFAESRLAVLADLIDRHPLGILITATRDDFHATHVPFILDRSRGPHGVLQGHLARHNPQYRVRQRKPARALVVFAGPQAYITPSWYPTKREHGKVVPTWDYVTVHARGRLRFIEDRAWLRPHLDALSAHLERGREQPWGVDDAPAEFIDRLQHAIVGVEIEIASLTGKWKVSQNRSDADIDGVIAGLSASPDDEHRALAEIVAEYRPRER